MKREQRIFHVVAAALAAGSTLAATASAASPPATLTIRHQVRGCHAWSFNGGPYKASLRIRLKRGTALAVVDNDVMPHQLKQLAGPKARLVAPRMSHMSSTSKVTFPAKGFYRFATRAGEDYPMMGEMKTIGKDFVLHLTVTVR